MKHELKPAIHMEKSLLRAWMDPLSWMGWRSEDLQGGANDVSQVDGVSDMAPACQLCGSVAGRFSKGTMASTHLSVWEKAVP